MSRKKPKVVDTVKHPDTGIKVDILMDPDTLQFVCTLPDGTQRSHPEGKTLAGMVYKWLDKNLKLQWHDVIEVEILKPFARDDGHFVGFEISRFHWAKKLTEEIGYPQYVKAPWGRGPDKEDDMSWGQKRKCGFTYVNGFYFHGKEFNPPCHNGSKYDAGAYYIPYSEEVWTGLEQMLKAIREIKLRLNKMLADPQEGHAYLAAIGANILKALPAMVEQQEETEDD